MLILRTREVFISTSFPVDGTGQIIATVANEKKYDYQMGVHYMDIIAECEKLGDYAGNVVEAHRDVKEKKAWKKNLGVL